MTEHGEAMKISADLMEYLHSKEQYAIACCFELPNGQRAMAGGATESAI